MLSSSNSKTSLAFMSFLSNLGLPNIDETMDIDALMAQFDPAEMGKKTECIVTIRKKVCSHMYYCT